MLEGHRVKRRGRGRAAMSSSLDDGRNLPYFGRKGDKAPIELYATTEHEGSDGNCTGWGPMESRTGTKRHGGGDEMWE